MKEDRIAKPEYKNAKISLPKHYYRETKISRDKMAVSKGQMNENYRKYEEHSNNIMKKVSSTKIHFTLLIQPKIFKFCKISDQYFIQLSYCFNRLQIMIKIDLFGNERH